MTWVQFGHHAILTDSTSAETGHSLIPIQLYRELCDSNGSIFDALVSTGDGDGQHDHFKTALSSRPQPHIRRSNRGGPRHFLRTLTATAISLRIHLITPTLVDPNFIQLLYGDLNDLR